jgi:hypothetical protein
MMRLLSAADWEDAFSSLDLCRPGQEAIAEKAQGHAAQAVFKRKTDIISS